MPFISAPRQRLFGSHFYWGPTKSFGGGRFASVHHSDNIRASSVITRTLIGVLSLLWSDYSPAQHDRLTIFGVACTLSFNRLFPVHSASFLNIPLNCNSNILLLLVQLGMFSTLNEVRNTSLLYRAERKWYYRHSEQFDLTSWALYICLLFSQLRWSTTSFSVPIYCFSG